MSGKALGWARDLRGLSGGFPAKAVLLLMADYMNDDGRGSVPLSRLSEELQLSPGAVGCAIATLIEDGVVSQEHCISLRTRRPIIVWTLHLDREVRR